MAKYRPILLAAALAYFDTFVGLLVANPILNLNASILKVAAVGALAPAVSLLRNGLATTALPIPSTVIPRVPPTV